MGKEPEQYRLDIVRLASRYGVDTGTDVPDVCWTPFHSGLVHGERCRAGLGPLPASWLGARLLQLEPLDGRDEL